MENNPVLGPRPGRAPTRRRAMSASRARLLDTLAAQPEPTTLAALVHATGLHANTVREHLEALERDGLVGRRRAAPAGRGRPAWLYHVTGAGPGTAEYAGLAAALAAAVRTSSAEPARDARVAGTSWGRDLARARGGARTRASAAAARQETVALLHELGFEPHADRRSTTVRLTRCPLLEAAHRDPEVVCAVHLGLVSGALEELGADPAGTELLPFAEPGACLLRLPHGASAARSASTEPR